MYLLMNTTLLIIIVNIDTYIIYIQAEPVHFVAR